MADRITEIRCHVGVQIGPETLTSVPVSKGYELAFHPAGVRCYLPRLKRAVIVPYANIGFIGVEDDGKGKA